MKILESAVVAWRAKAVVEKLVGEAQTPSEGIYYVMPNPDGSHEVMPYQFNDLPEVDHPEMWETVVAPIMARRFLPNKSAAALQVAENDLKDYPYGVPRGRVAQRGLRYTVFHGGDTPKALRGHVERAFSIQGRCQWELDEHEHQVGWDRDSVAAWVKLYTPKVRRRR